MEREKHFKKGYGLQFSYVILLTACLPLNLLYLQLAESILEESMEESQYEFFSILYLIFALIYVIAVLTLGILNIIRSFRACHDKETDYCINGMLILKYGLVIFFILNFFVIILILLGGGLLTMVASQGTAIFALPIMLPGIIAVIAFFSFITWLALIPGAFYGFSVIRLTYSARKLGLIAAFFHTIFQFTFLLDVLDSMYLSIRKWQRGKKSAVIIAVIYLVSIVLAIWTAVSLKKIIS